MRWILAFCVVALVAFAWCDAAEPCENACYAAGQVVPPKLAPKPMPGPGPTVKVDAPKKEHKVLKFLRHPLHHRKCR